MKSNDLKHKIQRGLYNYFLFFKAAPSGMTLKEAKAGSPRLWGKHWSNINRTPGTTKPMNRTRNSPWNDHPQSPRVWGSKDPQGC